MGGIGFWLGILVGSVIVAVMGAVALARKANARTATPTGRSITVTTALAPDAVFATLTRAPLGRFRLGDSDTGRKVLVFVSSVIKSRKEFVAEMGMALAARQATFRNSGE